MHGKNLKLNLPERMLKNVKSKDSSQDLCHINSCKFKFLTGLMQKIYDRRFVIENSKRLKAMNVNSFISSTYRSPKKDVNTWISFDIINWLNSGILVTMTIYIYGWICLTFNLKHNFHDIYRSFLIKIRHQYCNK